MSPAERWGFLLTFGLFVPGGQGVFLILARSWGCAENVQ